MKVKLHNEHFNCWFVKIWLSNWSGNDPENVNLLQLKLVKDWLFGLKNLSRCEPAPLYRRIFSFSAPLFFFMLKWILQLEVEEAGDELLPWPGIFLKVVSVSNSVSDYILPVLHHIFSFQQLAHRIIYLWLTTTAPLHLIFSFFCSMSFNGPMLIVSCIYWYLGM